MINPGDKAPGFTLPDQDGNPVKLSSFRGQPGIQHVVTGLFASAALAQCAWHLEYACDDPACLVRLVE